MRSRVVFLLALVMGVITTVLFFQYIQGVGHSQEVVEVEMTKVVVAAERIGEKQTVTPEMLKVLEVPKSTVHASAVTNMDEIVGKFSMTVIESDEILLHHRFKPEKEEMQFVSRKVQEGFRAVSIGADFVRSVSNLITPEDKVDIIFSEVVDMGETQVVITELILSEVRVLAVGGKMVPPTSENEEYFEYSSVTLELDAKDATTLVNASERGSIHFILHSSINLEEDSE